MYSGDIAIIWPMFGVANQLLAVIALEIGTTIILKIASKKSYALVTFVPLVFLTITEMTAGILNIESYFFAGKILNASIGAVLLILVVFTLLDTFYKWRKLLSRKKPVGMNIEYKFTVI